MHIITWVLTLDKLSALITWAGLPGLLIIYGYETFACQNSSAKGEFLWQFQMILHIIIVLKSNELRYQIQYYYDLVVIHKPLLIIKYYTSINFKLM